MNPIYKSQLYNQNPWWKDPSEINRDQKLEKINSQKIIYRPKLLDEINADAPGIYTLRGPRQVGKSTLLKLLIQNLLLNKKVDPLKIMFYSSEDLESYKDLVKLIDSYFEILGGDDGLIYIFIDEVSFIKKWERGIKQLYETGKLKNVFLLLSGSNAYDLHHQAERLPGRRGLDPYPDKIYLPLSFREFLETVNAPFAGKIPSLKMEEVLSDLSLLEKLRPLEMYRSDLVKFWNIYKFTGGFLKVIDNFLVQGKIEQLLYEVYLQWIRGDISKLKRSEKTAREILSELILNLVSMLEWQGVAKKIGIDSHKTVSDYASLFEDFFILKIVYQIDIHKKRPHVKKMKKVYFIDNFIFWTLWGWSEKVLDSFHFSGLKSVEIEPKLVEMFVADSLFRLDKRDWLSSRVFFWHGRKEIDFIVQNLNGDLVPLEVKYQNSVDQKDFMPMAKIGFKKGIIISKEHAFNADGFYCLPYYLWGLLES